MVLLVNARHLDYTNTRTLLRTLAKHPSDRSKNGDVGHAWLYLEGKLDGKKVVIEGGHSGELGRVQPKYFEGIMRLMQRGDPNPVRYLWTVQKDGFFQEGSGGHIPTFALKLILNDEQFKKIVHFIMNYDFATYSLKEAQCSTFLAEVAALAGLCLQHEITIAIQPQITIRGTKYLFWTDSKYSQLTISSPDIIERNLIQAVQEGKGKCALEWYLKNHPLSFKEKWQKTKEAWSHIPERFERLLHFLF